MSHSGYFDVIVVGSGPAGSSCATMLAQAGLEVLLIDRSKFPRDKICGDCINPGCWDFFDVLGVSHALRTLDLRIIHSVRIVTRAKKEIAFQVSADRNQPFFSVRRSVLDDVLMSRAMQAGATFLGETILMDAVFDGGWNVLVRNRSANESYRCAYLVGADGRNSAVATKIGAWSTSDPTVHGRRRIGIQCQTKYVPAIGSEVRLGTMKYGYFGIVNVNDECANVAMVANADGLRESYCDLSEFLEDVVCEHPIIGWEIGHAGHFSRVATTFPVSPVRRRWNKPQAFLAGDARQTVEPFTGEGVYFALQDGSFTAAEILSAFGKRIEQPVRPHRHRWMNRFIAPILNDNKLAESILGFASHVPWLTGILASRILSVTPA